MPPPKRPTKNQPPKPPASTLKPPPEAGKKKETRKRKTFSMGSLANNGSCGKRVCIYGESGMGKSTLAFLASNPKFITLDKGIGDLKHPVTGEDPQGPLGVETFEDVLDTIHSPSLFNEDDSLIVDTITDLEKLAPSYIFERQLKDGAMVSSLETYGYGRGFRHLTETMNKFLQGCDRLREKGVNVILLAQLSTINIANAEGAEFLQDGPDLYHSKRDSVRNLIKSWCDFVVKIDYNDKTVTSKGKVQGGAERGIFTGGALHFVAKNRDLENGYNLPELISFVDKTDDSFWKFLSGEAIYEPEEG